VPSVAEFDAADAAAVVELAETAPAEKAFCPWCDEEVSPAARKCKHCGELLDPGLRKQVANEKRAERRDRHGFRCPYCGSPELPHSYSQISGAGWVVFTLLLLFCLPLFWVGLLIREDVTVFHDCGMRLGG
jgi:hypothetical protein